MCAWRHIHTHTHACMCACVFLSVISEVARGQLVRGQRLAPEHTVCEPFSHLNGSLTGEIYFARSLHHSKHNVK